MWSTPPRSWGTDDPRALLLRGETLAIIERAIAELSPNQRAVVTLRDVEGLDSTDVCNVLGIGETNQRVLLQGAD